MRIRIFATLPVLFLLSLPIGLGTAATEDDPIKSAEAAGAKWLQMVDNGQYEASWDAASELFKKAVSKENWKATIENVRKSTGAVKSRKVKASQYIVNPDGAPEGEYVMIQYDSSFEGIETAVETLTPMKDKDGVWRVSGYYVK